MLSIVVIVSALIFGIIVPVIVLAKHYHPSKLGFIKNIFWIVVGIITWPLIPIVIAVRQKENILLSVFYISFLAMAVSAWYWSVLNVQTIIQMQQYLLHRG
ncbi:MAG TPA: hypothetical protein VLG38_06265 [Gammaproteobacteria bacterium]|nr:hypothetical protein [Gammaproteobacteria bacterium]